MKRFRLLATTSVVLAICLSAGAPGAVAQTAQNSQSGPVQAFYGRISPFYGRISPFWRDIRPFWGDTAPFWGANSPFTGDTAAFWGQTPSTSGQGPEWQGVAPFWRSISPFMTELEAHWRSIQPFENDPAGHAALRQRFQQLIDQSASFWGASVEDVTGKSFWDGFARDLFSKHGINLDDPSTFDRFTDVERAQFMFDWYDGLMAFSGRDNVDHWMKTANWTPQLTQQRGGGAGTVIGLIDFAITADADLRDNQRFVLWSGNEDPYQGHGGAVASLLVADHDGKGVMGIAPNASVAAFNPFDSSGSASWAMVRRGIQQVSLAGANVVNLSLGVPGSTFDKGWAEVYNDPAIALLARRTIFVHAAGNEGVAQTANLNWNFATDPNMIIVGSVGPSETISPFSNTPGNACLLDRGVCRPENMLKNRFLVAPGEWILVTDGEGGVRRASGTSFAAPIVTGAIALMHDRWGWLTQHPKETIQVLFATAKDLGEPGVDAVYGHGLIDIARSQQPVDSSKLYMLVPGNNGLVRQPVRLVNNTVNFLLNTVNAPLTVYEDVGGTYRDFQIPLGSVLTGTVNTTVNTVQATLATTVTPLTGAVGGLLSNTRSKLGRLLLTDQAVANPFGWELKMGLSDLPLDYTRAPDAYPFATEFSLTSADNVTLRFGNGYGAQALQGGGGFAGGGFDPRTGGANPVLGLASGGAFGKVELPLGGDMRLDFGVTERGFEHVYRDIHSNEQRSIHEGAPRYEATAMNIGLARNFGEKLALRSGYTLLQETNGVLGALAINPQAVVEPASTHALHVGVDWFLADNVALSASAMASRTRGQNNLQLLSVDADGVYASSFELALTMDQVFSRSDSLRVALVQPMHVEAGQLNISGVDVIDRSTGVRDIVSSSVALNGRARELALEAFYGRSMFDGQARVAGFVRAEAATAKGVRDSVDHIVGGQLQLAF